MFRDLCRDDTPMVRRAAASNIGALAAAVDTRTAQQVCRSHDLCFSSRADAPWPSCCLYSFRCMHGRVAGSVDTATTRATTFSLRPRPLP